MTETDILNRVLGMLDPGKAVLHQIRRNGHLLLAVPRGPEAARRTMRLYQPQRGLARGMMATLQLLSHVGAHRLMARPSFVESTECETTDRIPGIERGTCGMLLGSAEHRIKRAIASYRCNGNWEVAKIAFGSEGSDNLTREAEVLASLHPIARGIPRLLGIHQSDDGTILRMPYLTGSRLGSRDCNDAISLLNRWDTGSSPLNATAFPEWPEMKSALSDIQFATKCLDQIARQELRPFVRHGDFARWNLLRGADGNLMVIDWEWGHAQGMPGLDLVHYFMQDHRLVNRLSNTDAIHATLRDLKRPESIACLGNAGWNGNPLLSIIASLAWKQGAGHQDNASILEAAVAEYSRME
jgi:hypothetical protein